MEDDYNILPVKKLPIPIGVDGVAVKTPCPLLFF